MTERSSLSLVLAGPLQSWGTSSRFATRSTSLEPSKSGVLGLLAAAQGRPRTADIQDLVALRFGVRVDQPGSLVRDFQTERRTEAVRGGSKVVSLPLSHRYYLADAVFVVAVEGPANLIGDLAAAIRSPRFPLYLGRRACPPAGPLIPEVHRETLEVVLESFPYSASDRRAARQALDVRLPVVRDPLPGERASSSEQDVPISYDPAHRRYAKRDTIRTEVVVRNVRGRASMDSHDPMSAVIGS
ncbi:type I-E CRISPR-associated protein Cas5/CasD [Janibacter sp. GXQ6167]|uniref:type I-E CRISPR-associated protein Cas5/CasD n=1 Tax=Janibacter sp. GXQ6167 TaxID=3240791 RepID=UPI0035248E99